MKGVSKTKFCKLTGEPKRSGNYSPALHMHFCRRTYCVYLRDGEFYVERTPAKNLLPPAIIELMLTDRFFKCYEQEGVYEHAGKKYKCWRKVFKPFIRGYGCSEFNFSMEIDTEGDFEFVFPEY